MKNDKLLKRYLSDNARYADLINGFAMGGRQVVGVCDLTELSELGSGRTRDLVRKSAFGVNFAVIGVENQSEVHYLMPLRVMEYDAGQYREQAEQISHEIRKRVKELSPSKAVIALTAAEYLSRFRKSDRLHPCVTFVLYYGEEWDGSRDLHGLLDFTDIPPQLAEMVGNYHLNLLEIRKLQDTTVFQTDLKQVFDFIRFSQDKKKLRELVENDISYREMAEDAYDVAVSFTGARELAGVKEAHEKEGKIDMCQAIKEMLEDERCEGRTEGRKEGRKEGIVKGRMEGRELVNELIQHLIRDERNGEILRAVSEEGYQNQLLAEYGLI